MFRLEREVKLRDKGAQNWLAWADYLVIASILLSLLLVVLPLVALKDPGRWFPLAGAACGSAAILLAAYPFAIFKHYEIPLYHRDAGRPVEKLIVAFGIVVAALVFVAVFICGHF
jgi:hypothetical protein